MVLRLFLGEAGPRRAFAKPIRKVYYNLTITGLPVFVAVFIDTIEILGLIGSEHGLAGGFWGFMGNFDINKDGFVIVGITDGLGLGPGAGRVSWKTVSVAPDTASAWTMGVTMA